MLKHKRSHGLIKIQKAFRMRQLDPNLDTINNYTNNRTLGCYWKYDYGWKPFCRLIRNNTSLLISDEVCRLCVNDEYSSDNKIPINCQISNETNGKNYELQKKG